MKILPTIFFNIKILHSISIIMTFLKSQTYKENVMRRRKNKIIAGTVVAVMMAGSIMANISPLIASQTGANSVAASETFNKEGLWITEIYQNDVDRSEKNNTRVGTKVLNFIRVQLI